jgi:hypothetical protein
MVIKYTEIFRSKALQNLPKLEFLVLKQTIWQPWRAADSPRSRVLSSVVKKGTPLFKKVGGIGPAGGKLLKNW